MREALAKARAGGGPTLIEAVTYRLSDHTTADDATRYRPPEEVAAAWKREPVLRLRNYLSEAGVWNKAQEEDLLRHCNEQVQAAAQAYLDTPAPPVSQMFDHLYATLPAALCRAARGDCLRTRPWPRSRWLKRSTSRSRARWRTTPTSSCSARTSAATAACFARRSACSKNSAPRA